MDKELKLATDLIDFIHASPSPFHVIRNVKAALLKKGFSDLNPKDKWNLKKGGKYFTTKNDSSLVAFIVGTEKIEENGFSIIAAHTDSPSIKIKPKPEIRVADSYLKLNTEIYGGAILNTWFDRPLSLAGRVNLRNDNLFFPETKFVNIKKPILTIPNLAIHLNRGINEGKAIKKQEEMLPIITLINNELDKENFLINYLAKELYTHPSKILDFELNLYDYSQGNINGLHDEFISSGKLDDLAMVHAGIDALLNSEASEKTKIMVCFDNEEVGSRTKQGAGSPMLRNILERLCIKLSKDKEAYYRALYNSFLISADMAHALHPNYTDKHDPVVQPVINKGPVIKINADQKYTTDSVSSSVFETLCLKAEVPVQKYVNHSDIKGGSTLGNVLSSQLDIRSVDVGNPMLAMHSIRELGGVNDHFYMKKVFEEFYNN